jgi:pimeloyl-ACP methyl ester carboxylesterase
MTTTVASTDGVDVAVHELAGEAPRPILDVAHATGFHGRAYRQMARALAGRFHVYGADLRGHGDTPAPPDWDVDWTGYGDDATAVARYLAGRPGGTDGLVGFGHSKGGTALLMAARREPDLFRLLVLFEPIVFPLALPDADRPQSELPAGARRRRAVFPSYEAAIANFASKPPMRAFEPPVLEDYVRGGFGEDAEGVRIKCSPEHEARTFEMGGQHDTWDHLPDITVPTLIVAGVIGEHGPAAGARPIVERLPNGRYRHVPELDHFGPMTHPELMAELVVAAVAELEADPPPG